MARKTAVHFYLKILFYKGFVFYQQYLPVYMGKPLPTRQIYATSYPIEPGLEFRVIFR